MARSFAIKTICFAALVGCTFLLPTPSQGEYAFQEAGASVNASVNTINNDENVDFDANDIDIDIHVDIHVDVDSESADGNSLSSRIKVRTKLLCRNSQPTLYLLTSFVFNTLLIHSSESLSTNQIRR